MTTDAFPKFGVRRIRLDGRPVTVAVLAKGAGMIAPHMATLLVYILTDARVSRPALRRVLTDGAPALVQRDRRRRRHEHQRHGAAAGQRRRRQSAPDAAFTAVRCVRGGDRGADARCRPHGGDGRRGGDEGRRRRRARRAHAGATRRAWPTRSPARRCARRPSTAAIRTPGESSARRATAARASIRRAWTCTSTTCRSCGAGSRWSAPSNGAPIGSPPSRRSPSPSICTPDAARAERMVSDLTVDYVRFNSDYRT